MNLCIDCKHCRPDGFMGARELAKCFRPQLGINVVDGSQNYEYCDTARYGGCGLQAIYFEYKSINKPAEKTWFQKLWWT